MAEYARRIVQHASLRRETLLNDAMAREAMRRVARHRSVVAQAVSAPQLSIKRRVKMAHKLARQ